MKSLIFKVVFQLLLFFVGVVVASSKYDNVDSTFRPVSAVEKSTTTKSRHNSNKIVNTNVNTINNDLEQKESTTVLSVQRGGNVKNTLPNALAGAVVFAVIEKAVKSGLQAAKIKYPASLGACLLLFFFMTITDMIAPALANDIFNALTPGAAILAKWFPVFFVPGLALLPLSPPIGGPIDIFKVFLTVIVGFVYTLVTTLGGMIAVRGLQGKSPAPSSTTTVPTSSSTTTTVKKASPFSDAQWDFCWKGSVITGLLSVLATKTNNDLASPIQMLFTGFLTIASYIWGTRLPTGFVKLVHPLVTSSVVLLLLIRGLAEVTGRHFKAVLSTYKTGTLNPMKAGAGDYLLYILGPSVVSFAVSVYSRKTLLFQNLAIVMTAMVVSSAGSLYATGAFVRLIELGGKNGKLVRLSVLARNITTALAIAVTEMVGGDLGIVSAVVCLTGIFGASYGIPLMNALGIKDPICRGLGIGSAALGLGVAAISGEPDAFPFAAIAMVLTAISATTLVSFPGARDALIKITTGPTAVPIPPTTP